MKKRALLFLIFDILVLSSLSSLWAQGSGNALLIRPSDLRLVPDAEKNSDDFDEIRGYHLYIRKLPGVESVMLVETTKDPAGESDNYAYRALEYNKINGDEIRYLDGKVLESEYAKFSLVDSSAEDDAEFGKAFHIYIPQTMQFGYPWSRNGLVKIGRGTFLNIRSFAKKYADYTGGFFDNPYMFDLGERVLPPPVKEEKKAERKEEEVPPPLPEAKDLASEVKSEEKKSPVLTDDYNPIASEKFKEISSEITYSKGPETIVDDIMDSLWKINPKQKVDVVFVLDTTGSMKDDVEKLRKEFIPRLVEGLKMFTSIRIGLLLYRDYVDNYKYKGLPVKFFDFTDDVNVFTRNLNSFVIRGNEGGDIPEAVYEGLFAGLDFYEWREDAVKKIILIGDAEPHPIPRGTKKYTKTLVEETAREKNIKIHAIITPDEKSRRGR